MCRRSLLLIGVLIPQGLTAPSRWHVGGEVPDIPHPAWTKTDTGLQHSVTIDIKGRPIRVVLASIRRATGIDIWASRELEEFRVSIHVRAQSIGDVMSRLLDLLGHGTYPTKSCHWDRITVAGRPPRYVLRRTLYGLHEEEDFLALPRQTAVRWLREMRDYGQLTAENRRAYQGDNPALQYYSARGKGLTDGDDPVGEAIASLTDAQISALVENGRLELPQFVPSDGAVAKMRRAAEASAPSPPAAPPPSGASLRFEPGMSDADFTLMLDFRAGYPRSSGYGHSLDPLGLIPTASDLQTLEEAQERERGDVVDLLAHEKKEPGKSPVMSLAASLELLAHEANIPIYAEVFLKERQVLPALKGKPEHLLSQICRTFQCEWRKVGGNYLVWSKTWASDRAADIAEPLLTGWITSREKQGRLELADLISMAGLRDRQLRTLETVMDLHGPFTGANLESLRLLAALSPLQRQAAYSTRGAVLPHVDARQRASLQRVFGRGDITEPINIRLEERPNGVTITFSDQNGSSPPRWAYLGEAASEREQPDKPPKL